MSNNRSWRTRALTSVAVLAVAAVPAQALAQDADESGGLSEIIVTAQRREENLRQVPISVNAVSAETLQNAGVGSTNTLIQAVPSLNFTRSGPSGIFVIRGVATPNGAAGEEGSTAVYVDDVYMPDLSQTVNNFNNIQRIEVLNGPQGTLFGRNAVGGLIRIITRDPGDHTVFNAVAGYGNYDTVTGQAYLSTPLGEKAGWDIAFNGQHQGKGWAYNPTLNERTRKDNHWGLRSKLVLKPTDTLKITLAGDYYRLKDNTALQLFPVSFGVASPWPNLVRTITGPISGFDSPAGYPSSTDIKLWGVSGKIELETGIGTVTSITSYRKIRNESHFDVDGTATDTLHLDYHSGNETFQQEVRLASKTTEPLSWQLGVFYMHMRAFNDQTQRGLRFALNPANRGGPLLGQNIFSIGKTDSFAAFGEVTYAITPTTHLTGGIRWTTDLRKLDPTSNTTTLRADGTVLAVATQAQPRSRFNETTFRAALRQDLSEKISAYVSVNRGFKAGQYNLQTPQDAPVKPQTIMAYEAGLKGDFLDNHLRLNIAAFHYDINDYQIRSSPGGVSALRNAAKVKIDGVDINAEAQLSTRLHLTAGASWLNSRFKSFPDAGSLLILPNGDAAGLQTALAPHFTLNLGGTYTLPLSDVSELRLTANFQHKSSYVFEADNLLRQPAYDVVNASIEYKINDHFAVEGYMRNIGNKAYNVQMVTSVGQAALSAAPRQYGLNFKVNY